MPFVTCDSPAMMTSPTLFDKLSPLDERKFTFPDFVSTKQARRYSANAGSNCLAARYDFVVKVILIGDQGVGKTSFFKALQVHPDVVKATCRCTMALANDHLEMEVTTSSGKKMLVRLCDTGGQERYRSLTSSYYRGAHGVILMYDVNNAKSMDNIEMWLSDLDNFSSTSNCMRVLLGSKCASAKRTVAAQDARKYAESRALSYMEVDASQFYNVVESMQMVVNRIAKNVDIPPPSSCVIKPSISKEHAPPKKQFTCLC